MLLKEVIDLADKELPPTAIYLEASERGRPVYQRFGSSLWIQDLIEKYAWYGEDRERVQFRKAVRERNYSVWLWSRHTERLVIDSCLSDTP